LRSLSDGSAIVFHANIQDYSNDCQCSLLVSSEELVDSLPQSSEEEFAIVLLQLSSLSREELVARFAQ
jgi:hypothetical protein